MIVNLNVMCKVQLNEAGKQIWLSQTNGIPEEMLQAHPELPDTLSKMIDENNCLEAELWTIMNVFGPYISQIGIPFTKSTIELNKNPNFGNFS